jgi:VanZ family protein
MVALTTMPWNNYAGHPHWDEVRWTRSMIIIHLRLQIFSAMWFYSFLSDTYFRESFATQLQGRKWGLPLLLALTLSHTVELFQVYSHNRTPSTTDICTHLAGAMLGLMIEQWQ